MNPKELTIETLSVEIRVIRVGGHKMTISVFNQLRVESVKQACGLTPYYRFSIEDADTFLDAAGVRFDVKGYINHCGIWLFVQHVDRVTKIPLFCHETMYEAERSAFAYLRTNVMNSYPQLFIAT